MQRVASALVPDDKSKQSIRMLADRLLVVPSKEAGERKSRAGILIPATADISRRLVWAEVAGVGPTVRTVESGDAVLFSPDAGFEVEIQGDEY
jgi:chaperonin GroES